MNADFKKNNRILNSKEFKNVYDNGNKISDKLMVIYVLDKGIGESPVRLGLTVSSRMGNSVERNKIKRKVREAFRQNKDKIRSNVDIVFHSRKILLTTCYKDFEIAFVELLRKNKLFKECF